MIRMDSELKPNSKMKMIKDSRYKINHSKKIYKKIYSMNCCLKDHKHFSC